MKDLQQLRNQIDIIDDKIIDLFAQRFSTVKEIGAYKKKHNLSSLDSIRREKLLQSHINEGKKKGLSENFITDVRESIHHESLKTQQ